MNKVIDITIPLKTVSEANQTSEHWSKKHKRHKLQRDAIIIEFIKLRPTFHLPCQITLTRLSPRFLDQHDNLPSAFKWIVDTLAEQIFKYSFYKNCDIKKLGALDNHPDLSWKYAQEKSKTHAIKIEIWCQPGTQNEVPEIIWRNLFC